MVFLPTKWDESFFPLLHTDVVRTERMGRSKGRNSIPTQSYNQQPLCARQSVRRFPPVLIFNPHSNPHFRHYCFKSWLSRSHHVVAELEFENPTICLQGACLHHFTLPISYLSQLCEMSLKIGSCSTITIPSQWSESENVP